MRTHEVEAWALRAIERVENQQPNEDSRVELKAEWPLDPARVARRIAGQANALRGEPILWIIGADENRGVIGACQNEFSDWWAQVKSQFDGPSPVPRDVLVFRNGKTVVAIEFETDRVPFVVKNPLFGTPTGGPVKLEVPWREGTAVRSATHSDLITLLVPMQRPVLTIETGSGRGFVNYYPLSQPIGPSNSAHYVRVKVVNHGRRVAKDCACYLANVEFIGGSEFRDTHYADFMRLVWSHHPGWPALDLLPEVPYWLDVVSTLEKDRRFFLETDPKTPKYAGGFEQTTTYRLTIKAYAEESDPAQASIYLTWHGSWNHFDVVGEREWEAQRTDSSRSAPAAGSP
jgi:hypothetical protein